MLQCFKLLTVHLFGTDYSYLIIHKLVSIGIYTYIMGVYTLQVFPATCRKVDGK